MSKVYLLVVMVWSPLGQPIIMGSYYPTHIKCLEAGLNAQIEHGDRLISWNCELAEEEKESSNDR